ncbi:ubiquitin carboxyl-terminal hydrolase 4 isoform X2 [Eurytemora carolleeae]|uniref:ubiquitin carboxyl-terminal hydrolase 4 isoform X2 n=1 Tax=Eurytemora carolleeae TaxID=1294199 RepID=UPI000C76F4E3|nr:ubiquitin carboxyl-terminal hydrolase 4 isoform X2 [Eurytemora carolleeae]|eukprot:XP_023332925.1 ubiquitin carboxyl-terminal hydrolase 4-like isoform X2 [Eurytemora affinis]
MFCDLIKSIQPSIFTVLGPVLCTLSVLSLSVKMAADEMNESEVKPKLTDLFTSDTFHEALNRPLAKEDIWYLVDCRWFKQCRKYLGFEERSGLGAGSVSEAGTEEAHPGPIDNSDLMDPLAPSELKKHMIEEMNYCMVPADIWNPMQEQFGLVEGQEPLPRTVREYGLFVKHCRVEVYLTELCLALNSDPENKIKMKFSKADTIAYIMNEMRREFNIPETAKCRV